MLSFQKTRNVRVLVLATNRFILHNLTYVKHSIYDVIGGYVTRTSRRGMKEDIITLREITLEFSPSCPNITIAELIQHRIGMIWKIDISYQ